MEKQTKKTRSILFSSLLMLALLVSLNLVGSFFYFRLDFSKGKLFKLGKASREAVANLKGNMIVKVYASSDLPTSLSGANRYLKDLLGEYQVRGGNRFFFEYVNNANRQEFISKAKSAGLNYIVYQSYDENDQISYKQAIFGLSIEYLGMMSALNIGPGIEHRIEYEISTRIQELKSDDLPLVAVFSDSTYQNMKADRFEESMNRNFRAFEADLFVSPEPAKVLLFIGTLDSLSAVQLYNLDQYIMHGGKVVFLQERVTPDAYALSEIPSNIFDLLAHYGLDIQPHLVMDYTCDYRQGISAAMKSPYPVHPVVKGNDNSIITQNISNIVLYLASPIEYTGKDKSSFTPILQTSYNSALLKGPDFMPEIQMFQNPSPAMFPLPPQTVGALLKGRLTSYFAGRGPGFPENFKAETDEAQIVLFSDSELIVDADKEEYLDRFFIVLNAIDYLLGNESMINIRSRSIESSSFDLREYLSRRNPDSIEIAETELVLKQGIKALIITLPLLGLAILGVNIHIRTVRKRKKIQERYEKA